jgi:uncharacterized protein (DUF697 family)/tellurite resistance protein
MNPIEKESLLTLALLAAFADGGKNDAERAEFKRLAASLPADGVQPAVLYQRVLLKQVTTAEAAAGLTSPEMRQFAYEMAVCICDADGAQTEPERAFLAGLRQSLKLDPATAMGLAAQPDRLALESPGEFTPLPPVIGAQSAPTPAADPDGDRMILNYAILNGALELLPESIATMAIVPLQMKMVYRIGKRHGHELSRGHITELLGVAGIGLTSQVVEGYARKLLGGLLGKVVGGMGRAVGQQVASSALSFATTWALGKLAQQYYAGGRKLSALELRQLFGSLTQQARGLHGNYAQAIREKAGTLDLKQLLPIIRGQH